jgi:hypothetical protein
MKLIYTHNWHSTISDLPRLKNNQSKLVTIKYSTGEETVVEYTQLSNYYGNVTGSFTTLEGDDVTQFVKGWKPL